MSEPDFIVNKCCGTTCNEGAWCKCTYLGTTFDYFVSGGFGDDYNCWQNFFNINACKMEIAKNCVYPDFIKAFDAALMFDKEQCVYPSFMCQHEFFPMLNTENCCSYSIDNTDRVDAFMFNRYALINYMANANVGGDNFIRDFDGYRLDTDWIVQPRGLVVERMCGQQDFLAMYFGIDKCYNGGVSEIFVYNGGFDLPSEAASAGCMICAYTGIANGDDLLGEFYETREQNGSFEFVRGHIGSFGFVLPFTYDKQTLYSCLSIRGNLHHCLAFRPNNAPEFVMRDPCETDGVLYFGLTNLSIVSMPIKRIKCKLEITQSNLRQTEMDYYSGVLVGAPQDNERSYQNNLVSSESEPRYTMCFITFANNFDNENKNAHILPHYLANSVFAYLCNYKCGTGAYIAMCKNSLNIQTRQDNKGKLAYYTFQGYTLDLANI